MGVFTKQVVLYMCINIDLIMCTCVLMYCTYVHVCVCTVGTYVCMYNFYIQYLL